MSGITSPIAPSPVCGNCSRRADDDSGSPRLGFALSPLAIEMLLHTVCAPSDLAHRTIGSDSEASMLDGVKIGSVGQQRQYLTGTTYTFSDPA